MHNPHCPLHLLLCGITAYSSTFSLDNERQTWCRTSQEEVVTLVSFVEEFPAQSTFGHFGGHHSRNQMEWMREAVLL